MIFSIMPVCKLPAWTQAFSEASWLTERRIIGYSRVFVFLYAIGILIVLAVSPGFIDPTGKPVGTDFVCFWSAGNLALQGHPTGAYDEESQFAMVRQSLPWKPGQAVPFYPWHYPPIFLIVATALARLSYGAALGLWMALTLPLYLGAINAAFPGRRFLIVALAFPAVLVNLSHGQNGFLTSGLLGGGLVLLRRHPWFAGIAFGLLAYKPQFAMLVPLALLASWNWRSMIGAAASAGAAIVASIVQFGGEAWLAFLRSTKMAESYLAAGAAGWHKLQSVFAAVRMFGGSPALAYAAQSVIGLSAAAAVVWIWRRKTAAFELKAAVLATATLLITPYLFDYDLMILALPIAWFTAYGISKAFLPWEKITLAAAWALPLLSRSAGETLHVPLAPPLLLLLLTMLIRREARDGRDNISLGD